MQELSAIKYEVKKSRFFAHLYLIESGEDVSEINRIHRKLYKKAAHHCYAALFTSEDKKDSIFGSDGEVGHPGRVLLDLLVQNDLKNNCLVVSRIFGGIKLGPAGVSRAFRESGSAVIEHYLKSGGING